MENGLFGLTFGVMVLSESTLTALYICELFPGVVYFKFETELGTPEGFFNNGVRPLVAVINVRGPGV
jgi:hypothetical protein